jgi:hypothetical protein
VRDSRRAAVAQVRPSVATPERRCHGPPCSSNSAPAARHSARILADCGCHVTVATCDDLGTGRAPTGRSPGARPGTPRFRVGRGRPRSAASGRPGKCVACAAGRSPCRARALQPHDRRRAPNSSRRSTLVLPTKELGLHFGLGVGLRILAEPLRQTRSWTSACAGFSSGL